MIALMVFTVLLIYLAVAWLVIKRLPSKKAKWIAVAVFILIPTWDVILGRLYFYSLCMTEGGQNIYKTVEINKEYYSPNVSKAKLPEGQEWEIGKEYVMHIEGDHPMVKRTVKVVVDPEKLKDRYEIVVAKFANEKILNVQKISSFVKDKQTGEILGTATSFAYWGGWVAKHSVSHVVAIECPETKMVPYEPSTHSTLLERIFTPTKSSSERGH